MRFSPPLVLAGPHVRVRRLLKEGPLVKVHGRGLHSTRDCIFFLLSDKVLYATEEREGLRLRRTFVLADPVTRFDAVADTAVTKNAIAVLSSEKSSLFTCSSPQEKAAWLEALHAAQAAEKKHVAAQRRSGSVGGKVERVALPLFILDASVNRCMISGEEFSFFVRRHHCRVCGWSVGVCALGGGRRHVPLSLSATTVSA